MISLSAFMRKIEEHVNQYIIADLINLNFAHPHYPELKYDDLTSDVVQVITDSFMKLLEKDRVSDDMVQGIEEQAANRLDIDLEALKKQREKREKKEAKGAEVTATGAPKPADDEDKPEDDNSDDGGSAGNGDKFLSEGLEWWRPLTPAEESVKFADINAKMDGFEESFMKSAEPMLKDFIQNLVDDGAADKKISDINVSLPKEYASLVTATIKNAYNYAKTGAADEHNAPAPATTAKAIAGMKEMTEFVLMKQQADIQGIIADTRIGAQLADDESQLLKSALLAALTEWAMNVLRPTASSVVGRAVNNGRGDAFDSIANDDDLFQYSGLLDNKICSTFRSLDGKVLTFKDYAKTKWRPPLHFNCRCIWVLIRRLSADYKMPEVTGIDDGFIDKLEALRNTPKQQLIDEGKLLHGMTKVEKDSLLMYQGAYYSEINNHFMYGMPISNDTLMAAKRIDNLMLRYQTSGDITLLVISRL